MTEILSLWRSPLDKVALAEARALSHRQPRGSIGYGENFSAMTIYNYGYYIDLMVTPALALANMLTVMGDASPTGGLSFIPQKSFSIPITSAAPFSVPDQCVFIGSGGGGTESGGGSSFYHFVIEPSGTVASTFLSCSLGNTTTGGIYFRSLAFLWGYTEYAKDTCIYANVWNCRAINCTFTNCPLAFNAQANACTLEQCTINYDVSSTLGPNGATAVIFNAPECGALGPGQFTQVSQADTGPTGCTCIAVLGSAEHCVIADMQIYEWSTGVDFAQDVGAIYSQIRNCDVECWQTALNIALPANAGGKITSSVKVTSCILAKAADSTDGSAIVNIDAQLTAGHGNTNGELIDITLTDCTVFNMAPTPPAGQYGLEIQGGQNIKVIGGTYSNNSRNGGAGIAITGACGDVQIIGVNLQPNSPGSPNLNSQQYGLLVSGNTAGTVLVSGCDMTGYIVLGSSPVYVSGTPYRLYINDCMGYNDGSPALTATPLQLTTGVYAAELANPYFGPSVLIYSNGSTAVTLNIFGQAITSNFGIIYLPNAYQSFSFSTVPSSFSSIGK